MNLCVVAHACLDSGRSPILQTMAMPLPGISEVACNLQVFTVGPNDGVLFPGYTCRFQMPGSQWTA